MRDAPALGFLLAIAASIPFAAYIFPRKLSKLTVADYQFWLSLSVLPTMFLFAIVSGDNLLPDTMFILISMLCGVIWSVGSICYSHAVDNIGVARSTPVKNLAPLFATIYGIAIFQEYSIVEPAPFLMDIGGVALMILAATVLGRAGANPNEKALAYDASLDSETRRKAFRAGWIFSALAAFLYGAYSVPLKVTLKADVSAFVACAWLSVGVLIGSFFAHLVSQRRLAPAHTQPRELWIAFLAGGIWSIAQTLGTLAMIYAPISISWPVTNLSTLIAIGWGLCVFKEVHVAEHKKEIVWSLLLYSAGLVLLAMAAPLGRV